MERSPTAFFFLSFFLFLSLSLSLFLPLFYDTETLSPLPNLSFEQWPWGCALARSIFPNGVLPLAFIESLGASDPCIFPNWEPSNPGGGAFHAMLMQYQSLVLITAPARHHLLQHCCCLQAKSKFCSPPPQFALLTRTWPELKQAAEQSAVKGPHSGMESVQAALDLHAHWEMSEDFLSPHNPCQSNPTTQHADETPAPQKSQPYDGDRTLHEQLPLAPSLPLAPLFPSIRKSGAAASREALQAGNEIFIVRNSTVGSCWTREPFRRTSMDQTMGFFSALDMSLARISRAFLFLLGSRLLLFR